MGQEPKASLSCWGCTRILTGPNLLEVYWGTGRLFSSLWSCFILCFHSGGLLASSHCLHQRGGSRGWGEWLRKIPVMSVRWVYVLYARSERVQSKGSLSSRFYFWLWLSEDQRMLKVTESGIWVPEMRWANWGWNAGSAIIWAFGRQSLSFFSNNVDKVPIQKVAGKALLFQLYWDIIDISHCISLRCTMWWFMQLYTVKWLPQWDWLTYPSPHIVTICLCEVRTLKIFS